MYEFLISRIKDYIPLTDSEARVVELLFVKEYYPKNEELVKEGSICQKLFFISEGIVRFSQLSEGEERTFTFRAEGDFCNDLESFLQKAPSKSSITTIEPATILSITHENLQVFYNELRYGDRFGRLATEQVFIQVVNLLTTFNSETPEERYLRFVMNHKPFIQHIPQHFIASHIGVTPQALCRIKKNFWVSIYELWFMNSKPSFGIFATVISIAFMQECIQQT